MNLSRRHFIAALGAAPAAAMLPRPAFAAYPERNIRLIVPFAAGGNADIVGRLIGEAIAKQLNATVIVENRGGAGGGIGAEVVARAEPDGYTLLVASNGPMTVNPFVNAKINYDPLKDFAEVALTSYVPHALILTNKLQFKSYADLVAASKAKPLSIATSGHGSATHMTLERLKAASGANITHVPYRGGGALMPDVISGAIDGAMTEFSTAAQLHKGGQAHIIAVASAKRSQLAPDVPTFIESGVKGFTGQSYIGIVAPVKTPAAVVAQLQSAIEKGLQDGMPTAKRLVELGAEIATSVQMTSKGFTDFIHADYEDMREAAKLADIKPQ